MTNAEEKATGTQPEEPILVEGTENAIIHDDAPVSEAAPEEAAASKTTAKR